MCMCVLRTSISLFSASRVLNAFCTSLIIWKACPKLLIALEGPAAVERRELQEHMQRAQHTIITPRFLVSTPTFHTTANSIATRADNVFDSRWRTAYISFTKAISGLGKYVSSVRAMALQCTYTGSVSDNIHSHCVQWSMKGSGCTYVHARTEKIHSEIHVISFLTTADVLGKPSWRNNATLHRKPAALCHADLKPSQLTAAVCTFIVDMWKGVAVPCIGRITVSYFWSGQ